MKILASLPAMLLLGTLLSPAIAQDKPAAGAAVAVSSEPGKATMAQVAKVTGVVESIDLQARRVTVKDRHGKSIALEIGPEARNLEQVKVGDRVAVRYARALTLTLMKDGKELRSNTASIGGDRTKEGQRPGAVVGQKVEVTADVVAVNRKAHMVTLRGPEHEIDLKVDDPDQLKLIKVGDQVHAVYTEAVALTVEPAPAGKK